MFKYDDVVTIARGGILRATSHTLGLGSAYTFTKFKSEVNRLYEEWQNKFNSLPKEVGIDDAKEFEKRYSELKGKDNLSKDEKKELESINEKVNRLQGLQKELANDDAKFNIKPMPWKEWRALKEENREIKIDNFELLELIEIPAEGILWREPEEE